VRVSIATTDQTTVDNIVITDMLPAGFEPENGRLSNANEMPWLSGAATPDHLDIRDDRINIFTSAGGTERHFYYQVRAVSRGKFNMGNIGADAMYDGEYHSYHGANTIEIVERDGGLMP
jgi:hypothetical protein